MEQRCVARKYKILRSGDRIGWKIDPENSGKTIQENSKLRVRILH